MLGQLINARKKNEPTTVANTNLFLSLFHFLCEKYVHARAFDKVVNRIKMILFEN